MSQARTAARDGSIDPKRISLSYLKMRLIRAHSDLPRLPSRTGVKAGISAERGKCAVQAAPTSDCGGVATDMVKMRVVGGWRRMIERRWRQGPSSLADRRGTSRRAPPTNSGLIAIRISRASGRRTSTRT
jgi:hypothetical protein